VTDLEYPRDAVTGLVLAGGASRRMGGEDKGLADLAGRPMLEYVLDALRPQVGSILISANRNRDRYSAYGCPVVADSLENHPGPLAGVASALQHLATDYLLVVPCDAPLLVTDLAPRLHAACVATGAEAAVASDGRRVQPVFLLLRATVGPGLQSYLAGGGRKVDAWLQQLHLAQVDFSDEPDCFMNVNEPADRHWVEARLLASTVVG
jgi:molybdopterin-guanine dinucleotide biosynthesis protein A